MKKKLYNVAATMLSALAAFSVMPASLVFVNNPEPPAELLKK
ncbi:AgrD family cyclic lactone autoinducer peptide [Paenibacillus sp. FSL H7-0326]|nr:cyclic lactone autoinducer peptide [Paenibacillus sp. FSL H7-0326]